MLCDECQKIFSVKREPESNRPDSHHVKAHFTSSAGFQHAITYATKGCYICRAVLRQWNGASPSEKVSAKDSVLHFELNEHSGSKESTWLYVTIVNVRKQAALSVQPELVKNDDLAGSSTGSSEAMAFAKRQSENCNKNHAVCNKLRTDAWHPTRLIDLRPPDESGDGYVRLVVSREDGVSEPYASLSHCWGGMDILKLKMDNLGEFRKRISISNMPKTFVEAISVGRTLGIRYIWIDSLCIIQDSKDDWSHEAQRMLQVYLHACLNIAATASKSSLEGLFRDRDPISLGEEPIQLSSGSLSGQFRIVDRSYYTQMVDEAALNRRAWVVQERLLSSRTLHFAAEQLLWDCYELIACESCPTGVGLWKPLHGGYVNAKQGSWTLTGTDNIDEGIQQWADIVNDYSNTGLTFAKDKIIAIDGISNHLQTVINDQYCAGLWRRKMEMQMCWLVSGEAARPVQSAVRRAPTWSWFNVDVPVSYLYSLELSLAAYDISNLASVEAVQVNERTTYDCGKVYTGYLELRCWLNRGLLTADGRFDMPDNPSFLTKNFKSVKWDFDEPRKVGDEYYLVGLFENIFEGWTNWASEIRGIVLRHQPTAEKSGTYERCGHVFWAANSASKEAKIFPEDYTRMQSVVGKESFPCQEIHKEKGHLVNLV